MQVGRAHDGAPLRGQQFGNARTNEDTFANYRAQTWTWLAERFKATFDAITRANATVSASQAEAEAAAKAAREAAAAASSVDDDEVPSGAAQLLRRNLLIYGVNDIYDYETDKLNEKKNTYETLVTPGLRSKLWLAIFVSNFAFVDIFFHGNIVRSGRKLSLCKFLKVTFGIF